MAWLSKTFFMLFLMVTSIIGVSMSNFFLIWSMMEINLLLFIPIVSLMNSNPAPSLLGLKYFFIQSLGSIIFFVTMSVSMLMNFSGVKILMLISLSLLMKLGVPPFHVWLFNFMMDLDWKLFFIMSSWQKILPFYMLSQVIFESLDVIIILGLIVCSGVALNYSSMKVLLINSSLFTALWIICSMIFMKMLWFYLFFMYSLMLLFCVLILFNHKLNLLENNNYFSMNLMSKINVLFLLLSMAGLPPFLGFFMKLMILLTLVFYTKYFLAAFMLFCSIFLIYMYLSFFLNSLTLQSVTYKNFVQYKNLNYFSLMFLAYTVSAMSFVMY